MFMILERPREAIDASKGQDEDCNRITILAGRHEFERMANPFGYEGDWLVLKDTKIGALLLS